MNPLTGARHLFETSFRSILAVIICLFFSQANAFAQSADLAIQGASISPPSIAAGNNVSASGSIYNLGSATAPSSNIGFYLSADNNFDASDNLIGFLNGGSVNSGASSYRNATFSIPASTVPGAYYILYVADYLNGVSESNENNNVSSVSIAVVPPTMDLAMSYTNLSASSIGAGNTLNTEASVYNYGNSTAPSSHVGYYLSVNNVLDENDVFVGSSTGSSLTAGNYRYAYMNITIPANTTPGNYYIIFAADYLNGVSESNETNNTASRPITVASPFIDLVVQSPYLYNSTAVAGASVYAEFRVYNQGNITAASSNLGYYLSTNNTWDEQDVFMGSSSGSSLTANNYSYRSGNVSIPANTTPGAYYILFAADYLNGVPESNETNNAAAVAFTVVTPSIDLTLNALSFATSVSAGNPITVNLNVNNQGNTAATSSNLGFYLSANTGLDASDVLIGFQNGSSLSSNGNSFRSASVTIPASTTPGNYYLIAAADYLNSVAESNENNNTVQGNISITAQGTTFITPQSGTVSFSTCTGKVYDNGGTSNYANNSNGSITLNPATAGSKIRLIFSTLSVESCCDRLYIYDGTSTSAPLIGSYTTNPGTVYATNSSGALTLNFYTDGSATYSGFEADIACVTTVPLADLTVLSPTASPASLAAGTNISVSSSVSNSSSMNASSSTLGYYLSANNTFEATDVYLGNSSGSSLAAGASSYRSGNLTIPAATTPGAYYLLYVADYQNALSEENETNNVASVAINVVAPTIDLLLLSAFTSASTIASGSTFTTTGFIANQGSTPSPSSMVGYYLSANNTLETSDVLLGSSYGGTLSGGNSAQKNATLTLPAATPSGSYYVLFVADFAKAVTETNETNNTRSVPITVTSPNYVDLALQSPTLGATALLAGQTVAASVTISNAGNTNLTAHSSTVGFYLSSNNTFEASDLLVGTDTVATAFAAGTTALATDNLVIPSGTTPGSYYLLFVADYGLAYAEANKTNNLSTLAVTISNPAIDLVVQTPAATPVTVAPGAEITTTAAIRNQGTVSAATSTMGYYLSANATLEAGDELLGFYAGSTLAAATTSATRTMRLTLPAATPPGAYYILFAADHNNGESETNETNNVQAVAITVELALPNLTFNASTVSASSVVSGSLVSVSDSLQNYGSAPAASSPVSYYLSANATWDPADILLLATSGNPLAHRPHGGAYQAATLTIPANTSPGSYYLLFVADPDNQVSESNETDNTASRAITVTAPNVDLIVQNQSLSPALAAPGNSIAVAASISNQGTTPAGSSSIAYYLSANTSLESGDALLTESVGSNLAAGSSAYRQTTITIPPATPSGSYYILFAADPTGLVSETNETNNVVYQALTVSASSTVDLVVQSPSGFPASLTAGNTVSVSSFIYNQGLAAASASTVGYYLSTNNTHDPADVLLGFSPGATLAASGSAGKSETITIPANTHAGNYYLLFVADHAQAVAESNETNNTGALALSISAPAFADFTLQTPAASPAALLAGRPVTASVTLRNQGTAAASASTLGYYLSGDNTLDAADLLLDFSSGSTLEPGSSAQKTATLTIPNGTTAGNYFLLFAADHAQQVAESNETNNTVAVALTVIAPTVDLLVQNPAVMPAAVLPGHSLQVSAAVANQGTVAATSSTIGYYLSANNTFESTDVLLDFSAGGPLPASGTATKSSALVIPANTAAGSYYILFVADHAQGESESDETNNTAAIAFTVTAPTIDLALQTPAASVASLVAGNNLSVSATIQNSGTAPASASSIHFYLSANALYDAGDIALGSTTGGNLAAGSSALKTAGLTIPASTATGNYYLLFVADQTNAVTESDETNNLASVALAVTAPNIDLVVQNSTLSATSAVSGTTVTASTTLANTGNVAAPASTVGYYLSLNNTFESSDILLGNSTGGALEAGATAAKTATLTIPANTPAGPYYIIFVADHAAGVTENNETNNVVLIGLTVTSPTGPDLTATIPMTPTPVHPYVKGQTYTFTSTIRNQGNGASFSSSVGFYISTDNTLDASDVFLNGVTGVGLAATGTNTVDLSASVTIPANLPAGSNYKLLAVADYLSAVGEINEANNVAASAFVTVADASVDIAVQSPTASLTSVFTASSFNVTANLVNSGNTAATTNIGYYLSSNATLEATDTFLTSLSGISLAAGGSATRTASVIIPNGTAPGSYYLLAVADYTGNLTETNETNNVSSVGITVMARTLDLIAQSVTVANASLIAGSNTNATASIRNGGNTDAAGSPVTFYLSTNNTFEQGDVLLTTVDGGTLMASATASRTGLLTIPAATAAGAYFILAVADKDSYLTETDETNNVALVAITVIAPTVDLAIQSPIATATSVAAGNAVNLTITLANLGNTATATSNYGFYLSANITWEPTDIALSVNNSVGPLGAGGTASRSTDVTIPVNTAPGNYYLLLIADHTATLSESNETNNVSTLDIRVTAPASDFTFTPPVAITPNPVLAGSKITATANVGNWGAVPANLTMAYYFSSDKTLDGSDVLLGTYNSANPLNSFSFLSTSKELSIPAITPPGTYNILFVLDPDNQVAESNETANLMAVAFTVFDPSSSNLPDLLVQSPSVTPNRVNINVGGSGITLTATVANTGNTTAAASSLAMYISTDSIFSSSDAFFHSLPVPELAPNASVVKTNTNSLPAFFTESGHYYFIFVADNGKTVTERDETNNTWAIPFTLVTNDSPDLVPQLLSTGIMTISSGSNATITTNISNTGKSIAASSTLGYYLSADNILNSNDLLLDFSAGSALAPSASAQKSASLRIPATTTPGNYYILIKADHLDAVAELNETNNIRSVTVTVTSPSLPDLVPQLIRAPLATATAGIILSYQLIVQNRGTANAPGSTTGIFLSADNIYDASDLLLNNSYSPSLPPGASTNTSSAVVIPANSPPGDYFLLYVSDYHADITEALETNNLISAPVTITALPAVPAMPDLNFYAAKLTNKIGVILAKATDTLALSFTLRNYGPVTAGASTVAYYLSKKSTLDTAAILLGQVPITSLDAGSHVVHAVNNLIIPANTSPGNYFVILKADDLDRVSEGSEINNTRVMSLSITAAGVDLRVSSSTLDIGSGPAGTSTNVKITVYNYGTGQAPASKMKFYLSDNIYYEPTDRLLDSIAIGPLKSNQSLPQIIPLTIPAATLPGSYYILAIADAENAIAETQETNNTAVFSFTVGEIDLLVAAGSPTFTRNLTTNTSIPSGPITVNAGHRVETSYIIRNEGTATAPSVRVFCYLSTDRVYDSTDVYLISYNSNSLPANIGDTRQYPLMTIPANTRTGGYYVIYYIDHLNNIQETDETNNMELLPIQVIGLPLPDLAVQSPSLNPVMAVAGGSLRLAATLANTGTVAAGSSKLRYYLSADAALDSTDLSLGSFTRETLAGAASLAVADTVSLPANTAVGSYHLLFVADADSTVTEENEGNNFQSLPFRVGLAGVDLIVRSHTAVPSLAAGGASAILAKIYNQGVEAAASSKIGVYLSANNTLESSDLLIGSGTGAAVEGLSEAERNFGFTIPLTTAPGNYFLLYKVDHLEEVTESNESNNLQAAALTVTAPPLPDLALKDLALGAATIARGTTLAATATLTNQGTTATLAGKVMFYLSANNTFETGDVLLGESEVPALEAGASGPVTASLSIPAATAIGDYFILAVADGTGLQAETNEANNLVAVALAVSIPNGIQDLEDTYAVNIGPNPAPEKVYIAIDNLESGIRFAEVALHDLTGRNVFTARPPVSNRSLHTQVDVGHLSQGTYLLHIRLGGRVAVRKIVVERK